MNHYDEIDYDEIRANAAAIAAEQAAEWEHAHERPETCTWCESAPTYSWGYDEHNGAHSLCIDCHNDAVLADIESGELFA